MNGKNQKTKTAAGGPCLCAGLGPIVTEFLRHAGPPPETREHFDAARVEFLKGIRSMLDARIEHLSKPRRTRGQRVKVE